MSEHRPASDPPGAVSNQNGEEAQSGHRDDRTHPEPRTREREGDREGDREDARERAERAQRDER